VFVSNWIVICSAVMALQEAKTALGKGSLQKLKQDEQRKVRV
jgi:hypothetical protein